MIKAHRTVIGRFRLLRNRQGRFRILPEDAARRFMEDGQDLIFEICPIMGEDGDFAAMRAAAQGERTEHVFGVLVREKAVDVMAVDIPFVADAEGQVAPAPFRR